MAQRKIVIQQGATYHDDLTLSQNDAPIDLTGATLRGQIREDYESETAAAEFVGIIVNATAGQASLTIPASVTAGLPAGRYVYDVELMYPGGVVLRLFGGAAIVTPEVTR